jgi:PBP1b-binding outer membrane lipoprotein LpoB
MKKFLFLSVAILAFVLGSCSKEARLNRKLDGKWEVTTVDGNTVSDLDKYTVEFTKDKKGKGSVMYTSTSIGLSFIGFYDLEKNEKITVTMNLNGTTDTSVQKVKEYSKSKLVLTDEDGTNVTEFKKL